MRICLLADKYLPNPGGLAISAHRLAQGLSRARHKVLVCLPHSALPPTQIEYQEVSASLAVYRFGPYKRVDDTRQLWFEQIVKEHTAVPFDLLHAYYLVDAGFVATFTGRYLGIPSVISARGNDLDRAIFHPERFAGIRWALENASAVTAVSHDLAQKARVIAPEGNVHVIHNGVDSARFTPQPANLALKEKLGVSQTTPLLGFVGEARRKKGLYALLAAYAILATRMSGKEMPALLLIGGVRRDDREMVTLFQKKQPQLPLILLPYTNHFEMNAYYNLLDLLLLPSRQDGLPNSLLEGMAAGCAIVTTAVGGIAEVIAHQENGWLVPATDPPALANAILTLLGEPEKRAELGAAARETAVTHFTPAQELAKNLALYETVLDL